MAAADAVPWFIPFVGGAGLFLGGLFLLRRALRRLAGRRLEGILRRWAGSRWSAAGAGFLAAALLQSSSLTNLLVVNLTHARWVSVPRAVAMMLGANVGTTTTVQVIALRPDEALPYMAAAALSLTAFGRGRWRQAGIALGGLVGILAGIGLLGHGLTGLFEAAGGVGWQGWARVLARSGPGTALLGGTLLTAVIQSSSVTIGFAMALCSAGAMDVAQGIAFTLGANVGTVGSTLLGAIGASGDARRTAVADLLFNLLGVLLAWPFLPLLRGMAGALAADPARQIAAAHMVFNLLTVLIGLVLLDGLLWLADCFVSGRGRRSPGKTRI